MQPRALLFTASVMGLTAGAARADARGPVTWWVETRPWTCAAQTAPFAQQVQQACDASGTCAIAPKRSGAERVAVLACADAGWSLEAENGAGDKLWTLTLGASDDDDRLRRAAVWIARSEGTASLVDAGAAPAAPATHAAAPRATEEDAVASSATPSSDAPTVSFAAMAHSSVNLAERDVYGPAVGARALVMAHAPRVLGPVRFGVVGTAETGLGGPDTYQLLRGGAILGLGAPFDGHVLGASLEGGAVYVRGAPSMVYEAPQGAGAAYGQASLYAQIPGALFRPFASASLSAITDVSVGNVIPNLFAGLDLGFAWGRDGESR